MENYEDKIKKIAKSDFGAEVVEIKRITEGFSHYMYDVSLSKFPFEVIFRFQNAPAKDANILKEKWIMEKLEEKNIPVPKIHKFFFDDKTETGFMILEKFKGIRLDTIWDNLSDEEKISLSRKMGELIRKIHSIKLSQFGYIENYGKINSEEKGYFFKKEGSDLLYNRFSREWIVSSTREIGRMLSLKNLDEEVKKISSEFLNYLLKNTHKFSYAGEPTLVHGDFILGHIFVNKINSEYIISGLIDFEFALSHDPEYEFLKLHRYGFFEDKKIKTAFEEGYGQLINEENVLFHRIGRDFSYARVLLDSGNKEEAQKVLNFIREKINSNN